MNCRGEGGGERKNPHPHTTEGGQTQREDPGSNDEPGAPKETRNEKAESTPAPFDETNAKECGTRYKERAARNGRRLTKRGANAPIGISAFPGGLGGMVVEGKRN